MPTAEDNPLSGRITVFAAASLTNAFAAIATAFEAQHPDTTVALNLAGSQQLAAQINQGAPADVFASADPIQMQTVVDAGRIDPGVAQTFAANRLVLITPYDNPAGIATVRDLARPGLRLLLADAAVPAGRYSLVFLEQADQLPDYAETYRSDVLANVVSFEQNVRLVLAKVVLGEADAGIVYQTDAAVEADQIRQIAIPDELNPLATYPIAPVSDSANPELAQAFIDFVVGPTGQQILADYGFIPVGDATGSSNSRLAPVAYRKSR
jgi:molybdate transport system substrate-binding protein